MAALITFREKGRFFFALIALILEVYSRPCQLRTNAQVPIVEGSAWCVDCALRSNLEAVSARDRFTGVGFQKRPSTAG